MKYNFSLLLCVLLAVMNIQCSKNKTYAVMTFNIRYDNPDDGKNSWTNGDRKQKVIQTITKYNPEILGLQEVLHHQVNDIANQLQNYNWVGVGRDDGKIKGEYVPIFYNKNTFKLLKSGYFWLSETPTKPSLGWDATCCNRITTWVHLTQNNKDFYVFNTHYDHEGVIAQKKSSNLLIAKIKEIAKGKPTMILGDFNSLPNSKAITLLTNKFVDVYTKDISDKKSTFNAFKNDVIPNQKIDYIFVSKDINIEKSTIISDKINNLFPSDHLPILANISF